MTIRKLTSIILTMVMLISISVISVSAYDATIAESETISVSAAYDAAYTVKFVPAENATLVFESLADGVDTFCELYDENDELVFYSDDNDLGLNFFIEYEFEEGKTYYFNIYSYEEDAVIFDVVLRCSHSFTDDTCDNCGVVCDHSTDKSIFAVCDCGYAYGGADIKCGDTVTVDYALQPVVFRFIPEESGAYIFSSSSEESDPYCDICDASKIPFGGSDDFADTLDFLLYAELEAGETYYYMIADYDENVTFDVTLTKSVHTAKDGTEHRVEYHEYAMGTCQEMEYSEGLYCPECEEYIAGHIETGYGIHEDFDWDNICDYCGEEMYEEDTVIPVLDDLLDFMIRTIEFFEDVLFTLLSLFGISESDFSCNIFDYII